MRVVSSLFGIGKSTVHSIVHEFVDSINNHLLKRYIKFPLNKEELKKTAEDFEKLSGYPQSVGAVDGCHISVCPPQEHARAYYNFKGGHSIVLFAVVNAHYHFTFICSGHPGRNNDSMILKNSLLQSVLDGKILDCNTRSLAGANIPYHLISDSAFPLTPHIQKPFPDYDLSPVQKNFNRTLSSSRRVVENAFGRLKGRFRKLQSKMEFDIRFSSEVIKACAVLHNIAETNKDAVTPEWLRLEAESCYLSSSVNRVATNSGKLIRDAIAQFLFDKSNH